MDAQLEARLHRMFPQRNWDDISGHWLTYINPITPPGSKPLSPIEGFIGFEQIALNLSRINCQDRQEVNGFREIAFHEAMYLLHKASHAIGCAEVDADGGACTWSLSQAYQGSFFAAKSICNLLGGMITEYDRNGILIDLWPGNLTSTSGVGLLTDKTISFWYYRRAPGHMQTWQLFQHLLRTTRVNSWSSDFVNALTTLLPIDFAKQRNVIHYGGGSWIFDDLLEFTPDSSFGVIQNRFSNGFAYDENSDFTFVIALVIFRLALLLVKDMRSLSNKLEAEFDLLTKRLTTNYHPYHSKAFPK